MKIDYKVIGERIKTVRKEKGWSQDYLSEKLDVSIAYLSRVERGSSEINLKRLFEISEILEVPIEYLLNGTATTNKNYLDKELYEILIKCTPEKQRLVYDIAKIVAVSDFI